MLIVPQEPVQRNMEEYVYWMLKACEVASWDNKASRELSHGRLLSDYSG
jgi:hypothetical protein